MKSKQNVILVFVCVALPLAILTASILIGEFGLVDDSLIAARYAGNLTLHSELAFNPGERVEGYTSFLFVIIPAVLQMTGAIEPDAGVFLLSFLSALIGCALTGWFAFRSSSGSLFGAVLASAGLALFLPWSVWAASGMETTAFGTLWLATIWCYFSQNAAKGGIAAGILLSLSAMTRPEGLLLLPFLWVISIFFSTLEERRNRAIYLTIVFLVLFGTYFVWRFHYFGYLLPNTFYAKVDRFSIPLLWRGISYAATFILKLSPILIFVFLMRRLLDQRLRAIGLSLIYYLLAGIVAVGGDHFAVYRFGVHLLPGLFLLTATLGSIVLTSLMRYVSLTMILISSFLFIPDVKEHKLHVSDVHNWTYLGEFMKERFPREWSIATLAIGAIGYYSDLRILDMYGIVDTHIAHQSIRTGAGFAGHEKHDNAYILSRKPDVILLDNQFHTRPGKLFLWRDVAPDMEKRAEFRRDYRFVPVRTSAGYVNFFIRKDHR